MSPQYRDRCSFCGSEDVYTEQVGGGFYLLTCTACAEKQKMFDRMMAEIRSRRAEE